VYNGIINVYKEAGFTSFDVVAKLRGILKQKKIGHTGTLDPDATGVLPVCLGNATKVCDILTDRDKEYEATLLLGTTTDTLDISGNVLSRQEPVWDKARIEEVILSYVKEYDQIPPMYSAIKVNGQRLYELARKGIEVERKHRKVIIRKIEIISMELPYVSFKVLCSKGTYIRSLCDDIGRDLGCGAVMTKLVRLRVSSFTIGNALSLSQIEAIRRKDAENNTDCFSDAVIKVDAVFSHYKACKVKDAYAEKCLLNGNKLSVSDVLPYGEDDDKPLSDDGVLPENNVRMYRMDGTFIAIYKEEEDMLLPVKMFL